MPLLLFWPLAGACGAGEGLPRCAQLLWCELYIMKDLQKKNKKKRERFGSTRNLAGVLLEELVGYISAVSGRVKGALQLLSKRYG